MSLKNNIILTIMGQKIEKSGKHEIDMIYYLYIKRFKGRNK